VRGNTLYLILRFWDGRSELRFAGLENRVINAHLLSMDQRLEFSQDEIAVTLHGLPTEKPALLFPVVKLELDGPRGLYRRFVSACGAAIRVA
jgi:alpha-L-fucosidase